MSNNMILNIVGASLCIVLGTLIGARGPFALAGFLAVMGGMLVTI